MHAGPVPLHGGECDGWNDVVLVTFDKNSVDLTGCLVCSVVALIYLGRPVVGAVDTSVIVDIVPFGVNVLEDAGASVGLIVVSELRDDIVNIAWVKVFDTDGATEDILIDSTDSSNCASVCLWSNSV